MSKIKIEYERNSMHPNPRAKSPEALLSDNWEKYFYITYSPPYLHFQTKWPMAWLSFWTWAVLLRKMRLNYGQGEVGTTFLELVMYTCNNNLVIRVYPCNKNLLVSAKKTVLFGNFSPNGKCHPKSDFFEKNKIAPYGLKCKINH